MDDGVAYPLWPPRHLFKQLLLRHFPRNSHTGAEDFVVLLGQPRGLSSQVYLNVQIERGDQFPGVETNDDLFAVNDRDGRGFDPPAF